VVATLTAQNTEPTSLGFGWLSADPALGLVLVMTTVVGLLVGLLGAARRAQAYLLTLPHRG